MAIVIAEENNIRANVRLLQCDTISQAKEKIFDHIYKSQPVSTRPYTFYNSDLHFLTANGRVTVLRDFDYTTVEDGDWKRVNTLSHYEVVTLCVVNQSHVDFNYLLQFCVLQ